MRKRDAVTGRRVAAAALVLVVAGVLAGVWLARRGGEPTTAPANASGVPRLRHVVEIVFENKERQTVMAAPAAREFRRLAAEGAQATSYDAVGHPSLPNYLALVSGSTHGVVDDCTACNQSGPTIGSQLSARGRSWGAFAEGYPRGPGFAKRHVPFLYFPQDRSGVKNLGAFDPSHLPDFAFVVPNLCHDMHNCSVATGDRWLARFVRPLLQVPRTVVFLVFDEGTTNDGGGGNIPLIATGTAVKPGSTFAAETSHYGLLRTAETALGLPALARARTALPLTGIWRF